MRRKKLGEKLTLAGQQGHWPVTHNLESSRTLVLRAGHNKVVGQLCMVLKCLFFRDINTENT